MILSFDPGDVTVGFAMATWDQERRKFNLLMCRKFPAGELYDMLQMAEALLQPGEKHTFIIENFRTDTKVRGAVFQWNEMLTSQMIGTLKYAAFRMNNSDVVIQEPRDVLGAAKRWAPFQWPKGHLPDDKSAYCHLAYWGFKTGRIDTTDDILENGQEKLW